MTVGILTLELRIPNAHSLKEKRTFLNSIKQRIRNRFNVSIAQLEEYKDKWQMAVLGISLIGCEKKKVNATLSHIVDMVEAIADTQLINYQIEII